MKRRLALLFLFSIWPGPARVFAADARNVLVVYSDNRLIPANLEIDNALRETLTRVPGRTVEIFAEFLDRSHFAGPSYEHAAAAFLREKYAAHRPDVIVAAADYALGFLLRTRDDVFPQVPIVFLAISPPRLH